MVARAGAALGGAASALLLVVCTAVSCQRGPQVSMTHLAPPADWEASVLAERRHKDAFVQNAPDTPLLEEDLAGFKGLDYWPPNPDYYFVGRIVYYAEPEKLQIATTAGQLRPGEKIGWVRFQLEGTIQTLQVYRMLDAGPGGGFFLPFKDSTAGTETYPSGRYLDLVGPDGGPYVLDFNRAYNPYCAYGAPERFACPVTPRDNHLSVGVAAGERGYKHGDTG